jgi:Domain of unknown function (DUF222)/HNH endonuclease
LYDGNTHYEQKKDLAAGVHAAHGVITRGYTDLFRHIAMADAAHIWEGEGRRSTAEWLSGELGISIWAARRWVTAAAALPNLPHISRAFEAGELGLEKVLELCRFATAETEVELVKWATCVCVGTIRERGDVEKKPSVSDTIDADKYRSIRWWWTENRTQLWLEGTLPAEQGAVVAKALDRMARRAPDIVADDEDDTLTDLSFEESLEARRADALVALASSAIAEDADPDRATVVVHAELSALIEKNTGCEIELDGVLHPDAVLRMLCDSRLQTVLYSEEGEVVGIGRASRTVPAHLLRQLRKRDRRCTFPGCPNRRGLHAHHIKWWFEGGPTDLDNLALVCPYHHKLVHEYNWGMELKKDAVVWYRPGGKRYEPGPLQLELVGRAPPTAA